MSDATKGPPGSSDITDFWKQWYETSSKMWSANLYGGRIVSTDPFSYFKQWYEATNETWSKMVGDFIGSEAFLETSRQWLESYVSFAKLFNHVSEQYFSSLQLPTRSDIARIAELIIALEEKVDRLEDSFEVFSESASHKAKREGTEHLETRLKQLESKLNTFLEIIDKRLQATSDSNNKMISPTVKGSA